MAGQPKREFGISAGRQTPKYEYDPVAISEKIRKQNTTIQLNGAIHVAKPERIKPAYTEQIAKAFLLLVKSGWMAEKEAQAIIERNT